MVPSVYEDGTLYNVLPSGNKAPDETGNHNGYDQTRADFTFSRGFNLAATRVNANGLIEKGRENLLLVSNSFNSGVWLNDDTTETSGFEGYDGTNDAWKLVGNTNASRHHIVQSKSEGGVNCWSLYAKASGHNYVQFGSGSTTNQYVNFDLSDGGIGSVGSDFFSAKTEDIGNGWYRLSVVDKGSTNGFYISLVSSKTAGWLESWSMPNSTDGIFIQNAQLEKGLVASTYLDSGATTATAGVLENTPRIDYSSGAGALLLESQRTNLITNSEYLEDSSWSKATGGTGSNPVLDFGYTSPEGVDNAYKVTFDKGAGTTTSDLSVLQTSFTSASNTASFYVKADAATRLMVRNSGTWAIYDITTEWTRIEKTDTGGSLQIGLREGYGISDVPDSCTVYLYGVQVESGATYGSSYVPTYGSAATRGADSFSVDSASAHINSVEGTIYLEAEALHDDGSYRGVSINDGTFTNMAQVRFSNTSNQITGQYKVGGSNTCLISEVVTDTTQRQKIAFRYKANDFKMYVNGVDAGSDTSGATNSANTFDEIKSNRGDGSDVFYGRIYKYILFDEGLSNSELESLTS